MKGNKDGGGPPFLGSWGAVYLLMTAVLVALMLLFYFFTKHFQ